jgi:hypothetical protein
VSRPAIVAGKWLGLGHTGHRCPAIAVSYAGAAASAAQRLDLPIGLRV